MKPMHRFLLGSSIAILSGALGRAQPATTAQEILAEATRRADSQHKIVFFDFSASWCTQCRRLDSFLSSPEIAPIVQKYFVLADVHYQENEGKHPELETPGADALMKQFGKPQGVPYFVFFDSNGQAIATSERPVTGNIGYPDAPEEIDWFMTMLRKAVPQMDLDERMSIESWLKRASTFHR